MKKKYILLTVLVSTISLSSCEDFLEQENSHDLNQETFFDSESALLSATAPLYNYVWAGFNDKFYYGMETDVPTISPPSIPITYFRTQT